MVERLGRPDPLQQFKDQGYWGALKAIRRVVDDGEQIPQDSQKIYSEIMARGIRMGLDPVTLQIGISDEVEEDRKKAAKAHDKLSEIGGDVGRRPSGW